MQFNYRGLTGQTVIQCLVQRCGQTPEATFVRHKRRGIWQGMSYAAVLDQVRQLTMGLLQAGLRRGDSLAIIGNNEPELFFFEYAAMAMGARAVCLYPDMLPDEVIHIVRDAEARIVVAEDQQQVDKLLAIRGDLPGVRRVVYWDPRGLWQYEDDWLLSMEALAAAGQEADPAEFAHQVAQGQADDWAVICYTSGTTGKPKGAILTHRQLLDNALRMLTPLDLRPGAEYLSFISPAWAAEQITGITIGVLAPLLVNFPEEPETMLSDLREIGVELVAFSPPQWEAMVARTEARMMQAPPWRQRLYRWALAVGRERAMAAIAGRAPSWWLRWRYAWANLLILRPLRDRLGLTRTRVATSTGAAMAPDVFHLFHGLGVSLRNAYGATEAGIVAMHTADRFDPETVGEWAQVDPGLGPPLEWRVTADGELLVRGGAMFAGYYGQPETTAGKFDTAGYYQTGDAVHVREDGQLVYLDRVADLRELRGGQRYPPQFIETRLRFSPFIREVAALGGADHDYVAALLDIDPDTVGEWSKEHRVAYTTHADLTQQPAVLALLRQEVERVNRQLPEGMRIRRFAILPKPIDADDAEMTRSRKLRRELFHQRYAAVIAALYEGAAAFEAEVPVKYRDGRTGAVRVPIHFCTPGEA